MATRYKGLRMGGSFKQPTMGNMKVQQGGIDFIEISARGLITEPHSPTSTIGYGHRKDDSGNPIRSSTTSTSIDLGKLRETITMEYDYGEVTSATDAVETNKWAVRRAVASSLAEENAIPAVPEITPIGLFSGAYPSAGASTIDQINFSSLGNATSTGSLSYQRGWAAQGSSTRAVFAGASDSGGSGVNTVIEYVTFGTAGNGTDFGDLTVARWNPSSVGNSTRGVWASGSPSSGRSNVMDYITFATTGNATDFGDIATQTASPAGLSSPTRGVIKAGFLAGSPYWSNAIDYITTATTGNSTDFGDATYSSYNPGAASSDTRGLIVGGIEQSGNGNPSSRIDYITIATTGNASDFGDLAESRRIQSSGASNNITAVFGGSYYLNSMEKITIATLGNGIDFGNLTQTGFYSGCSNSHGGLQ